LFESIAVIGLLVGFNGLC